MSDEFEKALRKFGDAEFDCGEWQEGEPLSDEQESGKIEKYDAVHQRANDARAELVAAYHRAVAEARRTGFQEGARAFVESLADESADSRSMMVTGGDPQPIIYAWSRAALSRLAAPTSKEEK